MPFILDGPAAYDPPGCATEGTPPTQMQLTRFGTVARVVAISTWWRRWG
jgi:hypothetical protein